MSENTLQIDKLRIIFIAPGHLNGNNGLHIYNVARRWHQRGAATVILAHGDIERDAVANGGRFGELYSLSQPLTLSDTPNRLTVIHAWTPRQCVRLPTIALAAASRWPYMVHLEDNEYELLRRHLVAQGLTQPPSPDWFNQDTGTAYTDPAQMVPFLSNAAGVSIITERLSEHVPNGIPTAVTYAGFDESLNWSGLPDPLFRSSLGVRNDEAMVVYAGSVVPAHLEDFKALVHAVESLRRAGRRVRLVQTGRCSALFNGVVHGGFLSRQDVARTMRSADVLVQPGGSDAFNDFRFPAKVPEFFATGRPTVLPATNIGHSLQDRDQCVLLHRGDALEIADAISYLLDDPARASAIGARGRKFALDVLSWSACADRLEPLYAHAYAQAIRATSPA